MSEEKKSTDSVEDAELNDLLESALKDFDKPPKTPASKKENGPSEPVASGKEEEAKEPLAVDETWTEDFIKQTADQFEKNFQSMMQNGPELGVMFEAVAQSMVNAIPEGEGDAATPDFQNAIASALKDLSATSENLQNIPNITEADLAAMFGQTSLEDGPADMFPFIQGMMQSILSKEVLYPSLKELVDKYPPWLEEQKAYLPPADLERFEKQFEIMQKVCNELEEEQNDDAEEVKKQRFEKTLSLMHELQNCGQPPEELIKEPNPLFQCDAEGNPVIPGMDQMQNCSIM